MKKRSVMLLIFLLIGMMSTIMVSADLIVRDPSADLLDDDFYRRHEIRIRKTAGNISYTACGPGGEVTVYKSPQNQRKFARITNGKHVVVTDIYTDIFGEKWAMYRLHNNQMKGWCPMAYLVRDYDYELFSEDYAADIRKEENVLSVREGEQVVIYACPGSDLIRKVINEEGSQIICQTVFIDEEGKKWGGSGEEFGWICLESPGAAFDELFPDGPVERDRRVLPEGFPDQMKKVVPREFPIDETMATAGGVIFAALLAGGLLAVIHRIRRKR